MQRWPAPSLKKHEKPSKRCSEGSPQTEQGWAMLQELTAKPCGFRSLTQRCTLHMASGILVIMVSHMLEPNTSSMFTLSFSSWDFIL